MLQWKIGKARITSIVESESLTSPRFLYQDVDRVAVLRRADAAPWLRPHFVNDEGYLLQKIQCLVIEVADLRIAVDTCIGNDKTRSIPSWSGLQGSFLEDLEAAGFPAASVTHVVCTHLHVDHVGWNTRLVDGRWVPTFPEARYVFVGTEFEHWRQAPGHADGDDVFGDSVAPIAEAGLADLVPPDHRICPEVRLQPTPGHTPGHVSVLVESGGERAAITGDMAHHPLQLADPDLSSMFDSDPDAARRTRRSVFPGWADGRTVVIGTHFGSPSAGTLHPDGDGYRMEVVGGG
jgi:glyoxylase-like metal-dependent hydrolase (beta-lactamase superfamily II)